MLPKKFYINVSIPYVNAKPHIGYALELLYADVLARWHRLRGVPVLFVAGTDEHGQKIARTAKKMQRTPQQHVDELSHEFRSLITDMNVSCDDFIRTTEDRHTIGAQALWTKMIESGDIEKGEYEGLYCVGCESYKTEKDLVDGLCPNHLVAPEHIKEENYFFRLSRYQQRLMDFYADHPDFVVPEHRFKEMKELVSSGLEDVSISRDVTHLSWGVPVPGDNTQVMYVWFEALMNYITAVGYGRDAELLARWWPTDVNLVGKDINRFHSVLWPAMLMSAGIEPNQQVAVHGFISVDGKKMSKSLGNVIDPKQLIARYGVDTVRYFLLREIPFHSDGDFSYARLEERYTADLANGLGNLLSRVTNMIEKYCNGTLEPAPLTDGYGDNEKKAYHAALSQFQFHKALEIVWKVIDESNEFIEQQKPWELSKTDQKSCVRALQHVLYAMHLVQEWVEPFLPETAQRIKDVLTAEQITKTQPLFPRLEEPA